MPYINKIFSFALILSIAVLFAILPSVNADTLMNGTQSGKSFFFIWGVGLISVLAIIKFWIRPLKIADNIGIIDFLLLLFVLYVIATNSKAELFHSLLFLELIGLAILYIILRQQDKKVFVWIFIAIIVGGLIQSIYGNLQLWGYFPSHHGLFKMTGSFFNPGPYAGYLAAVFPISLGFYLFDKSIIVLPYHPLFLKWISIVEKTIVQLKRKLFKTHFFYNNSRGEFTTAKQVKNSMHISYFSVKSVALISLICMCLVLPASRSRAAWLAIIISSLYLLSVKYQIYRRIKLYFNTLTKKILFVGVLFMLMTIFGGALYFMKKGSADGRLLIGKVSIEMIKDKPILGYGYDGFKRNYMDYQSKFFKDNPNSKEILVAGDSNYAFNEPIQLIVEYGLIGTFPLILVILLIFKRYKLWDSEIIQYEGASNVIGSFQPNQYTNGEPRLDWSLLYISRAVILSFFVFSLFSYPLQILPIKICLVVSLAVAASVLNGKQKSVVYLPIINQKYLINVLISIISIGCFCLLWVSGGRLLSIQKAYIHWKNAFDLYNYGIYDDCLSDYKKAYPILNANGDFLTNYGKALSMAGKHSDAVLVLQRATLYFPNIVVYTALGDSYKILKRPEHAEHAYMYAWYMNPSRFYPKYLLAKLYNENGQKEEAIKIAKELLEKEIKIESTAIKQIRDEMKKIINE
jgi:O-antigen polymerase